MPLAPDEIVSHEALLEAVHAQLLLAEMPIVPEPPAAGADADDCCRDTMQAGGCGLGAGGLGDGVGVGVGAGAGGGGAPFCRITARCPLMVIAASRADVLGFDAAWNCT